MLSTESSGPDKSPDISSRVPCAGDGAHEWHRLVRIKRFQLLRCTGCGLIATEGKLAGSYDGVYKDGVEQRKSFVRNTLQGRLDTWNMIWSAIQPFRRNGTLLEVGAGYGHFLAEAQRNGWRGVGVEPSRFSATSAREELGVDVRELRVAELSEDCRDFDVIAMWDVIEHLEDPVQMLLDCGDRLRPGGILVIRTPDARILEMAPQRMNNRLWVAAHIQLVYPANPAEHIYHFTPGVMCNLLKAAGYETISTRYETLPKRANLSGRNPAISIAKRLTAEITRGKEWPHEFIVLAQRPAKTS